MVRLEKAGLVTDEAPKNGFPSYTHPIIYLSISKF